MLVLIFQSKTEILVYNELYRFLCCRTPLHYESVPFTEIRGVDFLARGPDIRLLVEFYYNAMKVYACGCDETYSKDEENIDDIVTQSRIFNTLTSTGNDAFMVCQVLLISLRLFKNVNYG